jgi:hypothetical protein
MSISRLDCDIFRGSEVPADLSGFVALNPGPAQARAVFAGTTAVAEGIGSQVAYRLGLEYFVKGVLDAVPASQLLPDEDAVTRVVENAFRIANSSVYNFGHRLAAGGRMAASMVACVVDGRHLVCGRVGFASVYLFREGQLFPLFPNDDVDTSILGDISEELVAAPDQRFSYIGSHAIVDVNIASVNLEPLDTIISFSRPLTSLNETLLFQYLEMTAEGQRAASFSQSARRADDLCLDVFTEPDLVSFCCLLSIGPDAIYCSKVVK